MGLRDVFYKRIRKDPVNRKSNFAYYCFRSFGTWDSLSCRYFYFVSQAGLFCCRIRRINNGRELTNNSRRLNVFGWLLSCFVSLIFMAD